MLILAACLLRRSVWRGLCAATAVVLCVATSPAPAHARVAGTGFSRAGVGSQARSIWDGVYVEQQASRGQQAYLRGCTYCHGGDLRGADDPPGPALKGEIFLARWDGRSVADLFTKICETMPLNNPATLSVESCSDVVSFVLQSNGAPAGASELSADADELEAVLITRKRQ